MAKRYAQEEPDTPARKRKVKAPPPGPSMDALLKTVASYGRTGVLLPATHDRLEALARAGLVTRSDPLQTYVWVSEGVRAIAAKYAITQAGIDKINESRPEGAKWVMKESDDDNGTD